MKILPLILFLFLVLSACGMIPAEGFEPFLENTDFYEVDDETLPDTPEPHLHHPRLVRDFSGVLHLPMRRPLTLNPLVNADETVARVLSLLFEPLAVLDEKMRPVGHLAALKFALDFTSVAVTIRSEAIWSDGLPVTSDDLIFSVETIRNNPGGFYYSRVTNIADIQRIDERTVHIHFKQATPAVGYALLFPLIPRHDPQGNPPVGNAPFLFESMIPLQSMSLVRNPHTFRTRPVIERVEVLFLPETQIDLYAFDHGLVDAIRLPFPEWARNPSAKTPGVALFPAMYFEFIGFNFARSLFTNATIRQGIAQSFDINEAISTLYLHHAVRTYAPIHPQSWLFDPTVNGFSYDAGRARTALRALPRGEPLVIIVGEDSPERVAMAYRLAGGLYALNTPTEIHSLSAEGFAERLSAGEYDLFIGWMELPYTPDFSFFFNGDNNGGVPFIRDAYLEELFAATQVITTETAYLQTLSRLQHAFAELLPVIPLAFRHSAVLTHERIAHPPSPVACNIFLFINEWSIITQVE